MSAKAERMVPLGYGKWVRADRIFALVPFEAGERGGRRRARVWVEGLGEPLVASRSERAIIADMRAEPPGRSRPPVQDPLF